LEKTHKIQSLIRTTAELFIIIIMLFSILSPIMNSWIVEPGYRYNIENEIYQVDAPMNFSRIFYTDTFIVFNNTGFNMTSSGNILITLRDINESTTGGVEDDVLLEFEVYLVSGTTTMSISGFRDNILHNIYKDAVSDTSFLVNSSGCIDITVGSGVSYIYTIYRGADSAPVISNPYPSDGATNIPVGGTPINVYISDADGSLMNVSIWSDHTGSWVEYAGYGTWLGSGEAFAAPILDRYNDGLFDLADYVNWTAIEFGWQPDGRRGFYENPALPNPYNMSVTDDWGMINYSTTYNWSVNVTDGTSWTNQTFSFTTLANTAPTITNPSPGDGVSGVSVSLASLSVTIADGEDTFNWTIITSPNIGSSGANGESNGVKTCAIAGLNYDGYYTWTVSVTDGTSWTNQTFDFTVESDPGGGPPPNSAPTTSNPYPADGATLVHLMPICHVFVADANLDSIDVNFYWLNETSVWNLSQTNSSVSSGSTVYWNYTNATEYETTYGWKVTADDGTINISHNYTFTTWTNTPQVNWTLPTDGTVDIPLSGVTVNAELFDYQGDKMNVSIWSNYTGSWVEYAGRAVWSEGHNDRAFVLDYNDDGSWNFQDIGLWAINNGWGGNGTWGFYTDMVVTNSWGMNSYSTTYLISINISDNSTDRAWNNHTFSFTTEINTAPVISIPIPRDGVRWVSVYTTSLSVEISDANSNFNYTIETDPNIGTISENNVGDGVKTCTVSGLNFSTTYTWYVNATDGDDWDNKSYTFTTKGETDFDIEGFKLNLPEWAMGPYKVYVGDFIWMFLFVGVIAISWGSSKHISTVFIVILLTFAAYGTQRVFVDNSEISLLFSLIAAVCIAAIMLGLFLKKKYG